MPSVHKALPLTLLLVVASLLVVNRVQRVQRAQRQVLPLDDWDIAQLVDHLRKQGLDLRVVATQDSKPTQYNAYLTTTDKKWQELNLMLKVPEQVAQWRGALYVERSHNADIRVQYWGDCCLVAGPFVFFGDRELLAHVRDALIP